MSNLDAQRATLLLELREMAQNKKLSTPQRALILDAIHEIETLRASVRNVDVFDTTPNERELIAASGLQEFWDSGSDNHNEFLSRCARLSRLSIQAGHNELLGALVAKTREGEPAAVPEEALNVAFAVARNSSVETANALPDLVLELHECEFELSECIQYATMEKAPLRDQEVCSLQRRLDSVRAVLRLAESAVGSALAHEAISSLADHYARYDAIRAGLVHVERDGNKLRLHLPGENREWHCAASSREFDEVVDQAVRQNRLRQMAAGA